MRNKNVLPSGSWIKNPTGRSVEVQLPLGEKKKERAKLGHWRVMTSVWSGFPRLSEVKMRNYFLFSEDMALSLSV